MMFVLDGQFGMVALLLLASGIADFLDGLIARALGVASPLGIQLDSLADMVSFGAVPGVILYKLLIINDSYAVYQPDASAFPAFILTLFAALRLAKFNIDTRQTEHFIGLATPSCTLFIVGLMLVYFNNSYGLAELVSNTAFIYGVILVFSILMVAPLPMFSFKLKSFRWKGNENQLAFALVSILLLAIFRELGLCLIVLVYILWNIAGLILYRRRTK